MKHVFSTFPILPNFLGENIKVEQYEYSIKTEHFGILAKNRNYYDSIRAIQGGILYDGINTNSLQLPGYGNETYNFIKSRIAAKGIHLFFDIGELNIAASRESLSLDVATRKNILNKIDIVKNSLREYVINKVAQTENVWEAGKVLDQIFGEIFSYDRNIMQIILKQDLTYNNEVIYNNKTS